jgi:hypothetical protein
VRISEDRTGENRMTSYRLLAYKSLKRSLHRLAEARVNPETAELLRDMAEGLLLTRDGELDQADELETSAALALSLLAGSGHLSDPEADALWQRMSDCGPSEGAADSRRRTMSNTGISWPVPDARSPSPLA